MPLDTLAVRWRPLERLSVRERLLSVGEAASASALRNGAPLALSGRVHKDLLLGAYASGKPASHPAGRKKGGTLSGGGWNSRESCQPNGRHLLLRQFRELF